MSPRARQIAKDLSRFDGKRTAVLVRIEAARARGARFEEHLVACAAADHPANVRIGATWILLRRAQENPARLLGLEPDLVILLQHETDWAVRLHLLQMLDLIDVNKVLLAADRRALTALAMQLASDRKTLVRAWSIGLLARLVESAKPANRASIRKIIDAAERNDAASVKARIRRIRAAGADAHHEKRT